MYEDPRFPNRKKRDWTQSNLDDMLTDAPPQDTNSEKTEEEPLFRNTYRIIEQVPETPEVKPVEAKPVPPAAAPTDAVYQAPADKPATPPPAPLEPKPPVLKLPFLKLPALNTTREYVIAGVALGVLFGVIIATFLWHSDDENGRYDLGPVTSSATGLKGHLFIEWDKKVEYRLSLEPEDSDQRAGFAFAVANPPRPLSIGIQLKNNQGFVLCVKDIVLKYDVRTSSNDTSAQGIDFARLGAKEAARESGKDVFQNQIGADGQIASINAQGEISCTKKAYENATFWDFMPNFPSLAEQDQLMKHQKELQADEARLASQAAAPRKKASAVLLLPFRIEGDDVIDDFDASRRVIETRGHKTFLLDKTSGTASDSRWQDYPVSIHYKCDQSSSCVLMHSGLGALRVRLKR